jgi:alkylation response protein AidB-like acyl-CoA dehydrogenase
MSHNQGRPGVGFAESDEHRALRAAVAGLAAKFGPRYYAERAAERRPCAELWQALGDAGIAAAGTPLLLLLVSAAISAEMISEFGTGEQRETWLPGLASGVAKVVFAITEPDAGSNTLRISTTTTRDGEEGAGFRQVFHGLNPERITGAALGVGIARYALGAAARYAIERMVWSEPIGTHQGVSHPLAKAKIETELAALMIRRAAWQHDHGQPAGESANMAKYAAAEAALAAVDAAIQTHGATCTPPAPRRSPRASSAPTSRSTWSRCPARWTRAGRPPTGSPR